MLSRTIKRTLALSGAATLLTLLSAPGAYASSASVHRSAHAVANQSEHAAAEAPLDEAQPPSNADFSGNGANEHGAYDSTRDGSASDNGNGEGAATGEPCAGCVGKADNKNPAGQAPDGSDANNGYECDGNSGVGRTNPAHTGCVVPDTSVTPVAPIPELVLPLSLTGVETSPSGRPTTAVLGVSLTRPSAEVLASTEVAVAPSAGLATTGTNVLALLLVGASLLLVGAFVVAGARRPNAADDR